MLCPPHPADALQLAATQVPRAQVVTALSGYSTAIMTMQYYAAKILRERAHPDRLRVFLQSTWHFRRAARHATWAALCLYLPAIGAR